MACAGVNRLDDAFTCLQTLLLPLASGASSFSLRRSISPMPTALTILGIGIVRALAERLCSILLLFLSNLSKLQAIGWNLFVLSISISQPSVIDNF